MDKIENDVSKSDEFENLMRYIHQNNLKVINIIGYSKSGKTTSIENLIKWIKQNGEFDGLVCVIKNIAHNDFSIDTKGKNTYRFSEAGADIVVARSNIETVMIVKYEIDLFDIIKDINEKFERKLSFSRSPRKNHKKIIILEGFRDYLGPTILSIKTIEEVQPQLKENIICFTGAIGSSPEELKELTENYSLPYMNCTTEPQRLFYHLFQQ